MATLNEITNASNYRGQPAAGGELGVGITIDTSPLQRLATFSFYAKRDQWEQKQRDNILAADKIANIAAYDITSPFTEYSNDLRGRLERMQKFVRDNPDSLVYSRNPQKFLEREEMANDFRNRRKIATVNDTLYNAAKAAVELMPNGAQKDIAKRRLDLRAKNLFADGLDVAYNRQFEATPPPTPQSSIIPTVPITVRETFIKLPNDNVTTAVTYGDLDDVRAKSRLIVAGGQVRDIKNSDWFKNLPADEQQLALEENELPLTQLREIESTAASINSLFAQWQAANPNIDIDTVDLNSLPNDSFGNQIRAARAINSQIDELNSLVLQGKILDPSKKVRTIPYEKFNLKDGLSAEEIISMTSIQESPTALIQKVDKTVQNTDDANQRRGQDLNLLSDRENRALQFGFGGDENSLLIGNALNDIEIPTNIKPGIYNMTPKGNKQSLANIQRLLGSTETTDEDGKLIKTPILPKEDIESNDKSKAISYEVETINGQPYVTKLQINNIWYDRGYFRNSQLNLDKEPKGGQKTSYKQGQSYRGSEPQKSKTIKDDPLGIR